MGATPFPLLRALAVPVIVLLAPLEIGVIVHELTGVADGYNRVVVVMAMDIGLVLLLVGAVPGLLSKHRSIGLGGWLLITTAAFAIVALPFHPSTRGASVVLRLLVSAVLFFEVRAMPQDMYRNRVVIPLLIAAGGQTLIALGQAFVQGPIGLGALGERDFFHMFGSSVGTQGTTIHPYVLAGFAMVAVSVTLAHLVRTRPAQPGWYLVGLGVAAVPLGITYSRMALLAVVATVLFLFWGMRRSRSIFARPLIVLIGATVLPALVWNGGWIDRAGDSVGGDLNTVTSNRLTLTDQAVDIAFANPLVGVGPGRYTDHLEATVVDLDHYDSVHTVPLVIAAENGLVAGSAVLALLIVMGARALRRGPLASAVFATFVPFVIFDKFPYVHPNGLVMLALWLALVDMTADNQREVRAPTAAAGHIG